MRLKVWFRKKRVRRFRYTRVLLLNLLRIRRKQQKSLEWNQKSWLWMLTVQKIMKTFWQKMQQRSWKRNLKKNWIMRTITNRLQQDCRKSSSRRWVMNRTIVRSRMKSLLSRIFWVLRHRWAEKRLRSWLRQERLHRFRWMRLQMHYRFPIQDFWYTAAMTCPDRAQKEQGWQKSRRSCSPTLFRCAAWANSLWMFWSRTATVRTEEVHPIQATCWSSETKATERRFLRLMWSKRSRSRERSVREELRSSPEKRWIRRRSVISLPSCTAERWSLKKQEN